ncbi:unnamed protein product [Peronospora belbahrii]|uniref:FYVE-type domain-containing protein n=1 Tax=Peronospora belbahrii TaxID=622444 RepID=A0AAU9L368_9STRA|nr:unnamed protein product [Peronospora belbahrii]
MKFLSFKPRTEAEKAQRQTLKELKRVAKMQRKDAAKEHKAQQALIKQEQKEAKRQEQEARKSQRKAVKVAKKASKTRLRVAQKTEKERARRLRQQLRRARLQSTVVVPPFAKSTGCYVCGKKFGHTLHRRRHHCRQCRESCCLQCMSQTRRLIPQFGLKKPQKVCVVCETLVFPEQPREPVEAVEALATSRPPVLRRPHSAPLPPPTDGGGVTVSMPSTRRGRTRSTKSKNGSLWTLPIRPLLKKKKSAEQRRNRNMDLYLQLEKQALFGGQSIELQPQVIVPPAP